MNAATVRPMLARLNAPTAIVEAAVTCVDAFSNSAWPAVVWKFSNLTSNCSPLEFAFSTRDNQVRFACEVGPPEMPASERVAAAAALADRLGAPPVSAEVLRKWQAMQSLGRLRWGAWLGVRSDREHIRAKIYVETPPEARASSLAATNRPILESGRLKMIGYDCTTQAYEYYYRQPQMNDEELRTFTQFLERSPQRQSMFAAFAGLCALPKHIALQWVNFGYSVTDADSGSCGFALFVRDRSIGLRPRIRTRFLEWQTSDEQAPSPYAGVFANVADRDLPDHEIVTFLARTHAPIEVRVAVSATALAAFVTA
jgi:hypothetical protein